jgi:hypothetical protein
MEEIVVNNFSFTKALCNGEIPEDTWEDYSFEGDFEEMFNYYMDELYDLGDSRVELTNGVVEKFIWIR